MSTTHSPGVSPADLLPPPGSGGLLPLVAISDSQLLYTDPISATSWRAFDNVEGTAGDIGSIVNADINLSSILAIVAANTDGDLFFTYLTGGGWKTFANVKALVGTNPGAFRKVAIATSGNIDVCGVTTDGRIWHTARNPLGSWFPFVDVKSNAGNPDPGIIVQVSCAQIAGDLYLCAVSDDGHLWITGRSGVTGGWGNFIDVETFAGKGGFFIDVDCVNLHDELHVIAATDDGRVLHTIRQSTWPAFYDVKSRGTGDRGPALRVGAGGGILPQANLQLGVITRDGRLWQADRNPDGSWNAFDDVEATAGRRGNFVDLGMDAAYMLP